MLQFDKILMFCLQVVYFFALFLESVFGFFQFLLNYFI
jgi:hypothetical protein